MVEHNETCWCDSRFRRTMSAFKSSSSLKLITFSTGHGNCSRISEHWINLVFQSAWLTQFKLYAHPLSWQKSNETSQANSVILCANSQEANFANVLSLYNTPFGKWIRNIFYPEPRAWSKVLCIWFNIFPPRFFGVPTAC